MGKFSDKIKAFWKMLGPDIGDEVDEGLPADNTAAIEKEYSTMSRGSLLREELKRRKGNASQINKPEAPTTRRGRPRNVEKERDDD